MVDTGVINFPKPDVRQQTLWDMVPPDLRLDSLQLPSEGWIIRYDVEIIDDLPNIVVCTVPPQLSATASETDLRATRLTEAGVYKVAALYATFQPRVPLPVVDFLMTNEVT
jgi:hypothetical protein